MFLSFVVACLLLSSTSPALQGGEIAPRLADEPSRTSQVEAATLVVVVEGMMKSRSGAT